MRGYYLVCYDVSDEKRLAKMHKKLLGFGDPLQYSVFVCLLTEIERIIMLEKLLEILEEEEDRLLIIYLGPENQKTLKNFEFYGIKKPIIQRKCKIV